MRRKKLKIMVTGAAVAIAIMGGIFIPARLHSGQYVDVSAVQRAQERVQERAVMAATSQKEAQIKEPDDATEAVHQSTTGQAATASPNEAMEEKYAQDNINNKNNNTEENTMIVEAEKQGYCWIEARIQRHIKEIHEDDLADFRLIMGKLDLGYISDIINGKVPGDLEQLLREYLRSKLDAREYERSKTLFLLYGHLMY